MTKQIIIIYQYILKHHYYIFKNMGNIDSLNNQCQTKYSRFKYIDLVHMQHFGQVGHYFDQITNQDSVKTVYDFILEADSEVEFINRLRMNNNNCPFLVSIIKIDTEIDAVCANASAIHIYFQYLPVTLRAVVESSRAPFPESQVRLLLGSLLGATRFLNENDTYHGDIYPDFIYLEQRGQRRYKIFDSAYFNPLRHGYYRAFEQDSYSSPEILANVCEKRPYPQYNHFVSDIFSIGLICLYVMTLINPITAYKTKHKEIDYYYIQMIFRMAKRNGYSNELLECIGQCIKLRNRGTAKELLQDYQFLNGLYSGNKLSLRR